MGGNRWFGGIADARVTTNLQRPVPGVPPVEHEPPSLAKFGELRIEDVVWVMRCNDEQTHALAATAASIAPLLAPGPQSIIGAALAFGVGYIEAVNAIGGNRGVEINGVLGVNGIIVTPIGGKLFDTAVRMARKGVTGRVITECIARAAAKDLALAQALGIPAVATAFQQIMTGTPLGWALAAATGYAIDLLRPAPDINAHGAVKADRGEAREWEQFVIGTTGATGDGGTQVTILSWLGHFSAQMGGGHGVYANRPEVGPWELWTEIRNDADGTYSYRTENGHYLCAEMGGGRECQANRRANGDWERFYKVEVPGARWALKTKIGGKFVSVQRDA